MQIFNPPRIEPIHDELFDRKKVKVFMLRDDLIHPFISGNKWRKLKYNIEEFQKLKKSRLLTFGGAYSNHIVATAAAGKEFGNNTVGIIRGEELPPVDKHVNGAQSAQTELPEVKSLPSKVSVPALPAKSEEKKL